MTDTVAELQNFDHPANDKSGTVEPEMKWLREKWFLYFSTCAVNLVSVVVAIGYGWPSPYIPKLKNEDDPDNPLKRAATTFEISWITSLQSAGAALGPIFTGIIASKIGKKRTLLIFSIPILVSSAMLIFASTVLEFYIARFLLGISSGPVFSIIPIYVAEISTVEDRGPTSVFLALLMSGSLLFTYCIGPYVSIPTVAIIALVTSVVFFCCFGLFVPETPFYFVQRHDLKNAEKVLCRLRGSEDTKIEFSEIIKFVEESVSEESVWKTLQNKVVKKCMVISIGMFVLQQLGGMAAVIAYQQSIFDSANTIISGDKSTIVSGVIQLLTNVGITQFINMAGRKKLMLYSLVGGLISLVSLGIYFIFKQKNFNMDQVSWIPIVSICFYIFCFNFGIGPVPWTIVGEIFPDNVKSHLSSLAAFSMLILSFLISLVFPSVNEAIGEAWVFFIFAIFTVVDIIFTVTVVPETKGKTFLEIQEILK